MTTKAVLSTHSLTNSAKNFVFIDQQRSLFSLVVGLGTSGVAHGGSHATKNEGSDAFGAFCASLLKNELAAPQEASDRKLPLSLSCRALAP